MRTPYGSLSRRLPAIAVALAIAGCGGTTVETVTERETVPASAGTTTERPSTSTGDRSAGGSGASTRSAAKKPTAPTTPAGDWVACDSNVAALRPHTSCGFAQNAFYGYWAAEGTSPIDVWSPSTKRSYSATCALRSSWVTCRTTDGGRVRFPASALRAYSSSQAAAYAAAHDVGPDVGDDATEDLSDTASPDDPGDEPTYDDGGSSTGDEIPNYDSGTGYRVQCADGMYSQSGGRQGACSGHGGVG